MIRVPPGRAGQVWLRRRLATAHRGIDILSRKQQLLAGERTRRSAQAATAEAAWTGACAAAEQWCSRSLRLGHRSQIALITAQIDSPATIAVDWRNVMAVSLPGESRCAFPDFGLAAASGGSSATDRAVRALADAVKKAADHAAIQRGLANIDAELVQTRRRLRLLQRRRLPQLEQALRESRERLAQSEREDTLRLRWAREH
ncbi:MAG: V-type ATP synthase subunit D [Candidatus Dormibacteria bacterium]